MILVSILSAFALMAAAFSGSTSLLLGAILLVVLLGAVRGCRSQQAGEKLQRVGKILSRAGFSSRNGDIEEQMRGLLWQSHSYHELGADLSELRVLLHDSLTAIRDSGSANLFRVPKDILGLVRSEQVLLLLSQGTEVLVSVDCEGEKAIYVGDVLRECEGGCRLCEREDAPSSLVRLWPNAERFLIASQQMGVESEGSASMTFTFVLGYREEIVPLPREKAIILELLRMMMRALRENSAIEEVSARALEEKKRQEKYFAHISHDIRAPLNNIQAILDLFFLEGVTEENKQFLSIARANCRSLRDIVEELLEFTKYKDGNLHVHQADIRVEDIVRDVASEFALSSEVKGVGLTTHIDVQSGVHVDRKHLKRIVMNLVSNGLKYTERGEVSVYVYEQDNKLSIAVHDTGVGIPKEKCEKLFTPFSRIGEVEVEGIGLGLTLTKILVEINGGEIAVQSDHGKGSVFTVSFDAIAVEEKVQLEEVIEIGASGHRILIVDDDSAAGATLARLLSGYSYQAQAISHIPDLKGLLNFWRPELIISDVHIPGGGIEKVMKIAHSFQTPVCALTGSVDDEHLQRLQRRENGIVGMQRKPVEPQELIRMIEGVLSQKNVFRQSRLG